MIAALISRRQERTPERDVIGEILFWKLDWCEQRPGLMFAAIGVLIVMAGVLEAQFP